MTCALRAQHNSLRHQKTRSQLRKPIFLVILKPYVLHLHKCDCPPNIFQLIYVGTCPSNIPTTCYPPMMSTETEHRVAHPVCKIKPTAALLQHAEKAALPSQTKAIHNFHTAEAAKHAAEHNSTLSPTETAEPPRTSPIPSASSAVDPRKRVHLEDSYEDSDGESGNVTNWDGF
jgi:hypothetical protein